MENYIVQLNLAFMQSSALSQIFFLKGNVDVLWSRLDKSPDQIQSLLTQGKSGCVFQ